MQTQQAHKPKPCPLCGHRHHTPMKGYEKDHLHRCAHCRFVFSALEPDPEQLEKLYGDYFYAADPYVSPITQNRYREWLMEFEPFRKTNRLLDMGCGSGIFLSVAREMGWDGLGVEVSQKAVEVCGRQGLDVRQGTLGQYAANLPDFDVVVSFEVMEHLSDPLTEARLMHQILRPGGLLMLTTPDFNALMRHFQKGNYPVIEYPEHLSYFTRQSLRQMMERAGFSTLGIKSTGISLSKICNILSKKEEDPFTAGSTDENLRRLTEKPGLPKLAKNLANFLFNITGTGNTLKGLFLKEEEGEF